MRKPAKQATASALTFIDAMDDPTLFGPWFEPRDSWAAWRVFAKALFGLPMTPRERETFARHTGRSTPPTAPIREAWEVIGRRGGKSLFSAALAVFLAAFRNYRPFLKPGERAHVLIFAADKDQATTVLDYIAAFFENIPMLGELVERPNRSSGIVRGGAIRLRNRVTIRVQVASFRRLRGRTVAVAILDEVAFWFSEEESRNPDSAILAALRPSMLTIPGALLLGISSPYAKRGILWNAYKRHYGTDNARTFVWKASTKAMNPSADPDIIAEAYEEDPIGAASEYGAEFRDDVAAFVSRDAVDLVTVTGREELPRVANVRYFGFCDPAGGSGGDSMTLAIAHVEQRDGRAVAILDLLREARSPFSPESVTQDFATVLKAYGLSRVQGDRYAGLWPAERFQAHGITYLPSEHFKSEIYKATLPLLNSGRVELLAVPRLASQLCALERRTGRGGRETVDHPPTANAHDDAANAAAGALLLAVESVASGTLQVYAFDANGKPIEPGDVASMTAEQRFLRGFDAVTADEAMRANPEHPCVRCRRHELAHTDDKCQGFTVDPRDAMSAEQRYELGED